MIQTQPKHRKNPIFATDPRTEYQTEKVPNEEKMVAQTKPRHRKELDNANFVEKKQPDIEKLLQALPIEPEDTEINIFDKDKNDRNIVKAVTVDYPPQRLSLQTDTDEQQSLDNMASLLKSPSLTVTQALDNIGWFVTYAVNLSLE